MNTPDNFMTGTRQVGENLLAGFFAIIITEGGHL
nr:MAG TPA: hypothetical protein [Caudoviricetes sp.]